MVNLWTVIIAFAIIIKIIDLLVKKKKKGKKMELIESTLEGIQISRELKKLEEQPNLYAIPKKTDYSGTIHPKNEGIIRWTKPFLRSLEWKRYEEICVEYLKLKNCTADVTCIGADGGIDIKIKDKNGSLLAVAQCKAWNRPIGVNLIRELYGVMAAERVKHGIFLTTSEYSKDAIEFAKGKNLLLIDCDELITLINNLGDKEKRKIDKLATTGDYTTPTCVRCNVKMTKRTAKTGKNAGGEFWGCVNYPKCKNTIQIRNNLNKHN